MAGENEYPSPENYQQSSFPLPVPAPDVDPDEGSLIYVGYNPAWAEVLMGAAEQLRQYGTWQGSHNDKILAVNRSEILKLLLINPIEVVTERQPYWDEEDGGDAPGDDEATGFPWYEEISDWIVTAFLATSFTPAAAIEFVTTARKLRLWFRTRDYGAIVRVLLDGLEIGTQDTYSLEPGMVEFAYDIPVAEGFSAQQEETWTLRLEHTGTANENAVPTADGFGMEVIRKHIEWGITGEGGDCPYDIRYNPDTDTVEVSTDGGETWQEAPYLDPRETYQQPPVATADPRCDAAERMTALLQDLVARDLQIVDEGLDTAAAVATILAGISFIAGISIVDDLIIAGVLAVLEIGSNTLHDAFDTFVWDDLKCQLYCLVSSEGRMDEAGMLELGEYFNTLTVTQNLILQAHIATVGWGGLSDAAAVRTETGDCGGCTGCNWCRVWDLTTGLHGLVIANNTGGSVPFGTWVNGVGVVFGDARSPAGNGSYWRRVFIVTESATPMNLQRIVLRLTYEFGGENVAGDPTLQQVTIGNVNQIVIPATQRHEGANIQLEWTGNQNLASSRIVISVSSSNNTNAVYAGNVVLHSLRLEGSGDNPYLTIGEEC